MNLIISIIIISITLLSILFGFVILKDRFEFILRFERLFHVFLNLEQNSSNFHHSFFQSLCSEMKYFFRAKAAFLYLVNDNEINLQSDNIDIDIKKNIKEILETNTIILNDSELDYIKKSTNSRSILNKLIKYSTINSRPFTRIIILPIVQDKTILSFFVFIYKRNIHFIRAKKILWLHYKRLCSILLSITNVTKNKEQNIFNIMLDNIRDYAFITSDVTHRITSWNKGSEIMFGFEYDEVFGKNLFELIVEEDHSEFRKAIDISKKKEETKLKIRMQDCNHTQLICEILLKQVKLNEISMGFYILIKDISKEEVLKANMKKKSLINRSIVENARDGIILLNGDDKIIFYNEKIKNISHSKLSFLGMDIQMIFPLNFGEKIKDKVIEVKNNWVEFQYLDLKFGDLWFNVRFFPIIEDKKYMGVIMFFIDNTLRMFTRKELEDQKEELEKINQDLMENMESARIMQLNLIPHSLPQIKGISFESIYHTSDVLGGDFFYVEEVQMDNKEYYVGMIADVSGHGVTASMFSVLVKNIYSEFVIRLRSMHDLHPTRLLETMNQKIINLNLLETNLFSSKFITVFIYILDLKEKRLAYSSSGHPRAILMQTNENNIQFLGIENSPPLGLYEDITFQDNQVDLSSGDKLVLYSDGLLDILPDQLSYESELEFYFQKMMNNSISKIKLDIENDIVDLEKKASIELDDITVLLTHIE